MPDTRWTARVLARNRGVLCASPRYLQAMGTPASPQKLTRRACLFIRESDEALSTWHLRNGAQTETVKVRGPLSANDGESATAWAMAGHGILMRSAWEVGPLLRAGQLLPVLPEWQDPAWLKANGLMPFADALRAEHHPEDAAPPVAEGEI